MVVKQSQQEIRAKDHVIFPESIAELNNNPQIYYCTQEQTHRARWQMFLLQVIPAAPVRSVSPEFEMKEPYFSRS